MYTFTYGGSSVRGMTLKYPRARIYIKRSASMNACLHACMHACMHAGCMNACKSDSLLTPSAFWPLETF